MTTRATGMPEAMTEHPPHTEGNLAQAVDDLSSGARRLVREELRQAQHETMRRTAQSAPGISALAVAGVLGVFTVASAYRFVVRVLEKVLSPTRAAALAGVGFACAGGAAAAFGMNQLRKAPSPLPADTARQAGAALDDASTRVRQDETWTPR